MYGGGEERARAFDRIKTSRTSGDQEPDFSNEPGLGAELRRIVRELILKTPLRRFVHQAPETPPQGPQSP